MNRLLIAVMLPETVKMERARSLGGILAKQLKERVEELVTLGVVAEGELIVADNPVISLGVDSPGSFNRMTPDESKTKPGRKKRTP